MDIYFISGVHGVGKGTLCNEIRSLININAYSCSDIIKANSDYIEEGKGVQDAKGNQSTLLFGLGKLNDSSILLDGHFCLLGKSGSIIELDFSVFDDIRPKKIITVTCDTNEIRRRLFERDGVEQDVKLLDDFQAKELEQTLKYCESRNVPNFLYRSGDDVTDLVEWIQS
ncbi:ATP-binding protein [Shewanella sp. GD03713]|uniref:ATP-binding protein n=1 Tax=Shewanella sp. GD03713 TaxID=2975372 RepID=UPI00244CEAD8|nr:ATP-binding protein [Shewanella sp. GD03713]MDH1472138.1 ATP-binding protein [Shewanella sp. GD03713]